MTIIIKIHMTSYYSSIGVMVPVKSLPFMLIISTIISSPKLFKENTEYHSLNQQPILKLVDKCTRGIITLPLYRDFLGQSFVSFQIIDTGSYSSLVNSTLKFIGATKVAAPKTDNTIF